MNWQRFWYFGARYRTSFSLSLEAAVRPGNELSNLPRPWSVPVTGAQTSALSKLHLYRPGRPNDIETGRFLYVSDAVAAALSPFESDRFRLVPISRGYKGGTCQMWAVLIGNSIPVVASESTPPPFEEADKRSRVCICAEDVSSPLFTLRFEGYPPARYGISRTYCSNAFRDLVIANRWRGATFFGGDVGYKGRLVYADYWVLPGGSNGENR